MGASQQIQLNLGESELFWAAELWRPLIILTATILFHVSPVNARLCEELLAPAQVEYHKPTEVLRDPDIHRAMELKLFEDFKMLVDLIPREMTAAQVQAMTERSQRIYRISGESAAIKYRLARKYRSGSELLPAPAQLTEPRWTVAPDSPHRATVDYIERTWQDLVRMTPKKTRSSLIPLPYPMLIPAGRFQEAYYWDSYFGVEALVKLGRGILIRGQI